MARPFLIGEISPRPSMLESGRSVQTIRRQPPNWLSNPVALSPMCPPVRRPSASGTVHGSAIARRRRPESTDLRRPVDMLAPCTASDGCSTPVDAPSQPLPPPRRPLPRRFEYNIETCSAAGIVGWVVHRSGGWRSRFSSDRSIGEVRGGASRSDVAAALPPSERDDSGFMAAFPEGTFAVGQLQELIIEFTAPDRSSLRVAREVLPVRTLGGDPVRRGLAPSSLPVDVVATLAELRPSEYGGAAPWSPELVELAVDDIVWILENRAGAKPILRYAHYLLRCRIFGFIGSHFDRINRLVDASAKDFEAVASSPYEMLCIANDLYVLRSRGARGGLVECGCFKGFSTCCLSQACAWLGMQLHVFDSFEGLPPSEGGYYEEHDFLGTMEEVTDNLRTFGQPSAVQFTEDSSRTLFLIHRTLCLYLDGRRPGIVFTATSWPCCRRCPSTVASSVTNVLPSLRRFRPQPGASEVLPPSSRHSLCWRPRHWPAPHRLSRCDLARRTDASGPWLRRNFADSGGAKP